MHHRLLSVFLRPLCPFAEIWSWRTSLSACISSANPTTYSCRPLRHADHDNHNRVLSFPSVKGGVCHPLNLTRHLKKLSPLIPSRPVDDLNLLFRLHCRGYASKSKHYVAVPTSSLPLTTGKSAVKRKMNEVNLDILNIKNGVPISVTVATSQTGGV
ncbi:unnamed protein product [Protopolystoma xenopodis]|uniref:Uncharacterized protein n=1 Tax=Protopolystoma xenopodis TaxID=117903 RepID=A0A3S5CDQ7_9PLAT|nr:unnamed protein product [Protopolystoma xenopodis]